MSRLSPFWLSTWPIACAAGLALIMPVAKLVLFCLRHKVTALPELLNEMFALFIRFEREKSQPFF